MAEHRLVSIRHGQSQWNLENRFTGWADVELTEQGRNEAIAAGKQLKEHGYQFDTVFTSLLTRAQQTMNLVLEQLGQPQPEVIKAWQLNERHYGGLTGLNKDETRAKYGDEQVHIWRRSYDIPPPEPTEPLSQYPGFDGRYQGIDVPTTESLKDTLLRVEPYWTSDIAPTIQSGKRVLIVAHGNSLRAMIKFLSHVADEDITQVEIPTGKPFVYDLDAQLKPVKNYYYVESAVSSAS